MKRRWIILILALLILMFLLFSKTTFGKEQLFPHASVGEYYAGLFQVYFEDGYLIESGPTGGIALIRLVQRIPGADADSIQVTGHGYYLKDKNYVYNYGERVENIDGRTFSYLGEFSDYGKDKNSVFYLPTHVANRRVPIITGVDAASFQMLCRTYGRDREGILVSEYTDQGTIPTLRRVSSADMGTFYCLSRHPSIEIGKDKDNIYIGGQAIGADPSSFKMLSNGYGEDRDHVYSFRTKEIVEGADPETFIITYGPYYGMYDAKDRNNYYLEGRIVTPATVR